jgi:UDP-N-acetylglucosamine transferase subunit ALG13
VSTFVSIGNALQPFPRLLDAVCSVANDLPQPVIVQYGNTPFQCSYCQGIDFMEMSEFQSHIKESELVILHAGAGSLINAIQLGKTPVVLPRKAELSEHIDNHQVEFSQELSKSNKAIVVDSVDNILSATKRAIEIQNGKLVKDNNTKPKMVKIVSDLLDNYSTVLHIKK